MNTPAIVFTAPGHVVLGATDLDPAQLRPDQVLLDTEASVVSPGTELAILRGTESWAPLPYVPGYGSVGRVRAVGAAVANVKIGDRVFTHGRHVAQDFSSNMIVPVPPEVSAAEAACARLAQVAFTAVRIAQAQLGDWVVVQGLGAVGNLAAQLFTLAGCEVVATDVSPGRCALARACGIRHVLPAGPDFREKLRALTGGAMARTVVDATGVPAVAAAAIAFAGPLGELILLGSPRGTCETDITPFLNGSHLWGNGCVTVKGAHEWRLPVTKDFAGRQPHSMEGNLEVILRLMAQRRLQLAPLLAHTVAPAAAPAIYAALQQRRDDVLTAVIDWTRA
ncbi:MAG: zinc-binding dehydrogenase [Opitutaceae bacterium]